MLSNNKVRGGGESQGRSNRANAADVTGRPPSAPP